MLTEKYEIEASQSFLKYEFHSLGPKGKIKKQIEFKPFPTNPLVFNIGFGDVDSKGNINDIIVSDNNDSQKVLATVALAALSFFTKHKNCFIYAIGSTKSRTRLYQIGLSKNLDLIEVDFEVFGFLNQKWLKFEKNMNYDAFLVSKK